DIRLLIVLVENVDGRQRQRNAGRKRASCIILRSTAGSVRIRGGQRSGNGRVKGQRLHVDAVVRVGGTVHDRRSVAVEKAVAAANYELLIGDRLPRKADAGSNVVGVVRNLRCIQTLRESSRVLHRRLCRQ